MSWNCARTSASTSSLSTLRDLTDIYDTMQDVLNADLVKLKETFDCGDLTAYYDGKNIHDCCVFADAVAAYKCTNKSARTYPLSRDVMEEFLKTFRKG